MIPLNNTVTIVRSAGLDDWGESVPGTESTHDCRITDKSEKVVNGNGEEVVGKGTILCRGFVDVKYKDKVRITKPDGTIADESPVSITYKKDLGSKILFTKVVI